MDNNRLAILKTLIYSDIFDYPLLKDQLFRFSISEKKIGKRIFLREINKNSVFTFKNNYYFLLKREEILKKRIEREKESIKKINLARKIADKISFIPTILFIGISGALSMKNSDKHDDIDLFIITRKNSVWITRLILILLLKAMGKYRKRKDTNVSNKICLNMIIDETCLTLPKDMQNLYSAHEVAQIMPIFQRGNTYKRFLHSNQWVEKFLPNAFVDKSVSIEKSKDTFISSLIPFLIWFPFVESISKQIQVFLINRHKTREIVRDNFLAFHPIDYKSKILFLYNKRLKEYGVS